MVSSVLNWSSCPGRMGLNEFEKSVKSQMQTVEKQVY
jgi:hypothetical protein